MIWAAVMEMIVLVFVVGGCPFEVQLRRDGELQFRPPVNATHLIRLSSSRTPDAQTIKATKLGAGGNSTLHAV